MEIFKKIWTWVLIVAVLGCAIAVSSLFWGKPANADANEPDANESVTEQPTWVNILATPIVAEEMGHTTSPTINANIYTASHMQFEFTDEVNTATAVVMDIKLVVDGETLFDGEVEMEISPSATDDYFSFMSRGSVLGYPQNLGTTVAVVQNTYIYFQASYQRPNKSAMDIRVEFRQIRVLPSEVE